MSNYINSESAIGIFDSGMGGISVLRELIKIMPNEKYIYYGDNANAPYGTKNRDEILDLTLNAAELLKSKNIKALVVACNTATSVAINILREKYTDIPIIGIEPAVKPASLENMGGGAIAVMATPATLKLEKFINLSHIYEKKNKIISVPCPGLVELIEQGITQGEQINSLLKTFFEPYINENIKAVVLGCTHYPFIKNEINIFFSSKVKIYDGANGTARQTKRLLEQNNMLSEQQNGNIEFISSSTNKKEQELFNFLLNI